MIINEIGQAQSIYDIFAICGAYILKQYKKGMFGGYIEEEHEIYYDIIETYQDERGSAPLSALRNLIKDLSYNNNLKELSVDDYYAIMQAIDRSIPPMVDQEIAKQGDFLIYTELNQIRRDEIRIIPVIKKTLISKSNLAYTEQCPEGYTLLRNRKKCSWSELDDYFENYIIITKDDFQQYPSKIYHLYDNNKLAKDITTKGSLCIGIFPLINECLSNILNIEMTENSFYIDGMKTEAENRLWDRYNQILSDCKGKNIDFLVFPEMLMSTGILQKIKSTLDDSFKFVINGSIWENKSNRTTITYKNGAELFTYYKREPFEFADKTRIATKNDISRKKTSIHKEWLCGIPDTSYSLIDIEGVGRIGVCICKDLDVERQVKFPKCMQVDFLFVPSYSNSMDMQAAAEDLSRRYNCIVILANSCSAYCLLQEKPNPKDIMESKEIGFITMPAKQGDDRSNSTLPYCMSAENCDCVDRCKGRIVTIDFNKIKNENGLLTFQSDICSI